MTSAAPALALRRATLGYGERAVVHDVDLEVPAGSVLALLGANGCGKTTLVRGLVGLADVLGGSVQVLGADVPARDGARIGYVPQRHSVVGVIPSTVRELVASGRLARLGLWRRPRRADREAVERAIAAVDLAHLAGADVARLSGGQQRRTLIARALASEPDLLLMDEPTAGVDRASQRALVRALHRLAARGTTLVVVTHEVGPIVPLVDRVVVLDEGRVSYDGPWRPAMLGAADGVPLHGDPPPGRGDRTRSVTGGPLDAAPRGG